MLSYDALFAAEQLPGPGLEQLLGAALGSARAPQGLAVGSAPVLRHAGECGARGAAGTRRAGSGDTTGPGPVPAARPPDPCAELFACPSGFSCVSRADGNVTCTSLCHRGYCKNHGICSHAPGHPPRCQ